LLIKGDGNHRIQIPELLINLLALF